MAKPKYPRVVKFPKEKRLDAAIARHMVLGAIAELQESSAKICGAAIVCWNEDGDTSADFLLTAGSRVQEVLVPSFVELVLRDTSMTKYELGDIDEG